MPRHSRLPARHSVRSSMLRWGAALGILVVLGVGVAELLLRSFPQHLPPATQFRLHHNAIKANEVHSLPDQELGYLWRPHVSQRIEGFNFGFDYSTDAHGFRNQGPWPDWADVVVVGDSQAFGFGVDNGESWARQMAELLPGLAIVNLGLIGAIDPAVAQEKALQMLAGLAEHAPRRGARSHQIAHRLVGGIRHPRGRQLAGPLQPGQQVASRDWFSLGRRAGSGSATARPRSLLAKAGSAADERRSRTARLRSRS